MEFVKGRQPVVGRRYQSSGDGGCVMAETTLVDFTSEVVSPTLSVTRRIARNDIVVSRCDIPINPGTQIVTAQFALFMHESEPLDLICHLPESRRTKKYTVTAGDRRS